jgi:hypothetical protein
MKQKKQKKLGIVIPRDDVFLEVIRKTKATRIGDRRYKKPRYKEQYDNEERE